MKEKKYLKISLGTGILIAIIVILIIALVGVIFYYNSKTNKESVENGNTTNKTLTYEPNVNDMAKDNNIASNNTANNTNTVKDPYEKYKNLKWECTEEATELEVGTNEKYIIKNGVLYYEKDGEKQKINSITDTPKYISAFITNRISQVNVLTEEGTIWRLGRINKNDYDDADSLLWDGKIDEFRKVDFKDKVVNITYGDLFYIDYSGYYYLLENGNLIDDKGISYDYLKGDFIKSIGETVQSQIFISSDNTISYFDYNTNKYIKIKNEKDTIIKVKSIFMNEDDNYAFKIFIVDENDILYCIDDYLYNYLDNKENITAKKYDKISNEQINFVIYDNSKQVKITFKDNKELILTGIIDTYEKAN